VVGRRRLLAPRGEVIGGYNDCNYLWPAAGLAHVGPPIDEDVAALEDHVAGRGRPGAQGAPVILVGVRR